MPTVHAPVIPLYQMAGFSHRVRRLSGLGQYGGGDGGFDFSPFVDLPITTADLTNLSDLSQTFPDQSLGPPIMPDFTQPIDLAPPDIFGLPEGIPAGISDLVPPYDPVLQPLIDSGLDPASAQLVADAAANGLLSDADFQSILNGEIAPADLQAFIYGGSIGVLSTAPQKAAAKSAVSPGGGGAGFPISAGRGKPSAQKAQKPTLRPGPSPRVAAGLPGSQPSSFWDQQLIPGLKNSTLFIIGGAVLLLPAVLPPRRR